MHRNLHLGVFEHQNKFNQNQQWGKLFFWQISKMAAKFTLQMDIILCLVLSVVIHATE